jgi:hypothetical protein
MSYAARRLRRAQREVASGGFRDKYRMVDHLGVLLAVTIAANLKDIQRHIKTNSM